VATENAEPVHQGGSETPFGVLLDTAASAVAELTTAAGRLGEVADDALPVVMRQLTTLVGQLDGVRVAVTAQVRDRDVFRRQGAASLAAWLRADVRAADAARSLSQLAAKTAELPRITELLAQGSVSLAQAGTACWQITHLPHAPQQPQPTDHQPQPPDPNDQPEPRDPGDQSQPPDPDHQSEPRDPGEQSEPPDPGAAGDRWAGLWRNGDLHAAADELFAQFLPCLDSDRLRALGAHLREAADAQERAAEDCGTYIRRSLRLSRGFGGVGELSGRLHPEATEQVLAAFEELGAKTSPEDTRTKAQRWADVLVYLTSLAGLTPPTPDSQPTSSPVPMSDTQPTPSAQPARGPQPTTNPGANATSAQPARGPQPTTNPGANATSGTATDKATDAGADAAMGGAVSTAAGAGMGVSSGGAGPVGLRRPRVIVTVPLSSLLGHPLMPGAVLGAGTPITTEAARRLSCDAEIIRLITTTAPTITIPTTATTCNPTATTATGSPRGPAPPQPGQDATGQLTGLLAAAIAQLPRPLGGPCAALDIGRKSQSWTPRQRDALHALYGGRCGAPGCTRPIEVIHHIIHWANGGPTNISNGAPFCTHDHWLVHEGGWQVTKKADGTLIMTPPPPSWKPGTIYRHGKPLPETSPSTYTT
jgi:Domain of unknown function (DUF222)/HNH endonuclease